MSHPVRVSIPVLMALSACSATPKPVASIAPPPAVMAPLVAMPAGANPGMAIPAMLADGSYPTPNRNLSPAAATWHLRAALNVAALACRGTMGDSITRRYNAAIRAHAPVLAHAEAQFASEFRVAGDNWRERYDGEMTRLYNFFALAPARADFCAAADRMLDEMAGITPNVLPGFAQAHMAAIDRPFTDFYRAYDAWRNQRPTATLAMAAATSPGPRVPYLKVDPAVFRLP